MLALCRYDWPGNVRELMNVIERAMLLCKTDEVRLEELPNVFNGVDPVLEALLPGGNPGASDWLTKTLPELQKEIMAQVERIYLQRVLAKTRGRVGQAARIAGIHPRSMYNKMKQLDLSKEVFKQ
jgi:DNA-binding NtrC family response regulator